MRNHERCVYICICLIVKVRYIDVGSCVRFAIMNAHAVGYNVNTHIHESIGRFGLGTRRKKQWCCAIVHKRWLS
jgi:hypothetical protein